MGLNFSVTRRALSLGSQDSTTGWYAKTFSETTSEKMVILNKGFGLVGLPIGVYAKYVLSGFSTDPFDEGDEVKDAANNYYEIISVEPIYIGDSLYCYQYELHKLPIHYDMPTTYGTGASVDDPRERSKTWLDTYLPSETLKKNDGSTAATYITCWANPPYPISKVYVTKGVDLIFAINRGNSNPLVDSDHYTIGYEEKISILSCAIDKTGISGDNLMWQGEKALRHICETYPLGSLRNFETMIPKTQSLGSTILYSVECVLEYERDA